MELIKTEDRETVVYKGKKFHRYPNSTRTHLRKYFWGHFSWKKPPVSLHRFIWEEKFGKIEPGIHIHHKNGNTFDNRLENLESISASEHAKLHMLEPERRRKSQENGRKQTERIIAEADKWRNNPENKKNIKENVWVSLHGKPQKTNCLQCGKEFIYTRKRGASYCRQTCGNKWRKENRLQHTS